MISLKKISNYSFISLICLIFLILFSQNSELKVLQFKEFQIKGALSALDDQILEVKALALKKLIDLGTSNKILEDKIDSIVKLLNDKDSDVRRDAISALGEMGEIPKAYIPQIVALQCVW